MLIVYKHKHVPNFVLGLQIRYFKENISSSLMHVGVIIFSAVEFLEHIFYLSDL